MKKVPSILFILVQLLISSTTFSQRLKLHTALGASAYVGDLQKNEGFLVQPRTAFTVGASYDITPFIRLRSDLSIMGIKGDDKFNKSLYAKIRNLNFKSNVWELAILGEYDFVNLFLKRETVFTPYIFGGPGVFHFKPTTIDRNGNKVSLRDIGTEGQLLGNPSYYYRKYSLLQLNFQIGGGFRVQVSDNLTLGMEVSYRKLNTDYIDDVHTIPFIDPAEFAAKGQTLAAQLAFRGDELGYSLGSISAVGRGTGKNQDYYYTFQLKANFRLSSLHIGRDFDYYQSSYKQARRSMRNPNRM
jgi:opacity protein-like surface antigen